MGKALDGEWLGFPLWLDENIARQVFKDKFGREPEQVHRTGKTLLLLGPIKPIKRKGVKTMWHTITIRTPLTGQDASWSQWEVKDTHLPADLIKALKSADRENVFISSYDNPCEGPCEVCDEVHAYLKED